MYAAAGASLAMVLLVASLGLRTAAAQAPVQGRALQTAPSSIELRLRRLEQSNKAALGLLKQIDGLRREVQSLRNENEKLANRLDKAERRLESVARNQAKAAAAKPAVAPDEAPAADVTIEDSADAQQAYQAAVDKLLAGEYASASEHFEAFLKAHGNGSYGSRAQYFLAESYYQQGRGEQALDAYRKLIALYPNDPKVPESGLKSAYVLEELGKRDQARSTLEAIVKSYPGTSFASMAEQRLEELR